VHRHTGTRGGDDDVGVPVIIHGNHCSGPQLSQLHKWLNAMSTLRKTVFLKCSPNKVIIMK
jgi:hypothetical protein